MLPELEKIKKIYGENMACFCRDQFPIILEKKGLLTKILVSHFSKNRQLYPDVKIQKKEEQLVDYVYGFMEENQTEKLVTTKKPWELLEEAGYSFFECQTEEEIQTFKKYYEKGEELCTFKEQRLKKCYVFFAVKKDVDKIRREDFLKPQREDLYGTSVISIQFTKGKFNRLSIKNRYNHNVSNPDATFGNNLDEIIPGLTNSFASTYQLNLVNGSGNIELEGYVLANDCCYYKYNSVRNNIYYCPNNIIVDHYQVKKYDTSQYLVFDSFLYDFKSKKVSSYIDTEETEFVNELKEIETVEVCKTEFGKKLIIKFQNHEKENVMIDIDSSNNIISYQNPNLEKIGNNFLAHNRTITQFVAPNVKEIKNRFLAQNRFLETLVLPKLQIVGNDFLTSNHILKKFEATNLKEIGDNFLYNNEKLSNLYLPNLKYIGDKFLLLNRELERFIAFHLIKIGDYSLVKNQKLTTFIAPNLTMVGAKCLIQNPFLVLEEMSLMDQKGVQK